MNVVVFMRFPARSACLPFGFFLPATMVAAWYGGFGPGLLAAFLGLLRGDYFFLPSQSVWDRSATPGVPPSPSIRVRPCWQSRCATTCIRA